MCTPCFRWHTPTPEDGNKLYQPAHRHQYGKVDVGTVRGIFNALSGTALGDWLVQDKEWLFVTGAGATGTLHVWCGSYSSRYSTVHTCCIDCCGCIALSCCQPQIHVCRVRYTRVPAVGDGSIPVYSVDTGGARQVHKMQAELGRRSCCQGRDGTGNVTCLATSDPTGRPVDCSCMCTM